MFPSIGRLQPHKSAASAPVRKLAAGGAKNAGVAASDEGGEDAQDALSARGDWSRQSNRSAGRATERLSPRAVAGLWLVTVAAGGLIAFWLWAWRGPLWPDSPELVLLAAQLLVLSVLAQHFPIPIRMGRKVNPATAAYLAGLLLLGAPAALLLAGASQVLGQSTLMLRRNPETGRRQRTWPSALFNTSQFVVATGLAAAVYFLFVPHVAPVPLDGWTAILAIPLAAAAMYLANTFATAAMAAWQAGHDPIRAWRSRRNVDILQFAALYMLGVLAVIVGQHFVWAPLLIAVPAAAMHASLGQFVRLLNGEQAAREAAELAVRARGEFLAVAAHELRTPVTTLRGYAQLLLSQFERGQGIDSNRTRRALRAFDEQSDKLTRLVAQLLDVSRIQAGTLTLDRQRVDLSAVLADAIAGVQTTTTRPMVINAEAPVWACIDALRLEQVVVNLLDNAIRYSHDEGPIEVAAAYVQPDTVTMSVRDRGIGIPLEHRRYVFERFYQAGGNQHVGGMGLGLYISRQIVEEHGGRIDVEAPPDGGTRFVITLPAQLEGEPPVSCPEPQLEK